jgi:tetratricopeptide (TPR) repeat protein
VRAAFEQGHLERRARRLDQALGCYEAVLAHDAADRSDRDRALVWIGRCQEQRGRAPDALRAWRRVAEDGADAFVRVEAFDLWALAYVAAGDLEAAAGVLALCQESLGALGLEESRRGERLRAALESMRAIGELQSAIERRWRAR